MNACLVWRAAPSAVLVLLVLLGAGLPASAAKRPASVEVGLFEAIERDQIEVRIIPHDARRLTFRVENKTDKPLSIRLPVGFVGVPVLAQQQPFPFPNAFPNQFPNPQNRQNDAPQPVAAPFPNPAQPQAQRPPFGQGPVFNVAPGKINLAHLPCVCLDHARRSPRPRIPYRIEPLERYSEKAELRELIASFGRGRQSRRVVQIAAWHLVNDMSWKELSDLRIKWANGRTFRRFTPAEIEAAKRTVAGLPSYKGENPGKTGPLSRR